MPERMYIGQSNLSKYVQNMYFGANLYRWSKYSVVHVPEITTYKWKRYTAVAKNIYKYWYEFDLNSSVVWKTYLYDKLFYLIGSVDIHSPILESEIQWHYANVVTISHSYSGWLLFENKSLTPEAYKYAGDFYTTDDTLTFHLMMDRYILKSELDHVDYSQGTFIDEVTSQTQSQYPTNGIQDGYWYVYEGSVTTEAHDIRGDYLTEVSSINASAYPEDGISESYWYTKTNTQENISIPITKGYIGVDQFIWNKYNAQWVDAVTTYTWKKYQAVISESVDDTRVNNAASFDLKYRIDLTNGAYYTRASGTADPATIKPGIQNGKYHLSASDNYLETGGNDIVTMSCNNLWIFPVGGAGDLYSTTVYLIQSDNWYDAIGCNVEPHGDYIYLMFSNPTVSSNAQYGTIKKYTIQVSAGDYVESIDSIDQSAYPTNGLHTDGYYYVYDKSVTVDGHYEKTSLVGLVTSNVQQTYPMDDVLDNYWYVHVGNNPIAKQFWPFTLFTWKQYQSVYHPAVTTYTWNRYTRNQSTRHVWRKYSISNTYTINLSPGAHFNLRYSHLGTLVYRTIRVSSNGSISYSSGITITSSNYASISNNKYTNDGTQTTITGIYAIQSEGKLLHNISADYGYDEYKEGTSQILAVYNAMRISPRENPSKGSFIENVYSAYESTYPTNGQSGSYWYEYVGQETVYSQGSYIDQVSSNDRSAYPDNNYSGSYWYVYNSSDTIPEYYTQGDYIKDVRDPSEDAYPENGRHADGYWYVKQ